MDNLLKSPEERIYFKDLESRFLFVSQGWIDGEASGRSAEGVLGKTDFDIFSEPHAVAAFEDEQRIIRTGEPVVGKVERETFRNHPDVWVSTTKSPLRDDEGRVIGTFGISRDVTAQIAAEQALTFQSLHDAVTGLANRVALTDRLSQALALLERHPGRLALLFVDLDNFKTINDSFGHDVGDKVLVEVARRLTNVTRRADTVARLGGDEFVMLCTGLRDDDDPRLLGDRVVRAVAQPFVEDGVDLSTTASVGIVLTSDPIVDPGELLQEADAAMYEAKEAGKNRFQVFTPSQRSRVMANHALEAELRGALDTSALFLLYQPLFSVEDSSLRGVEALVRWNHPTRGVVPPIEFIPLAEERGLITQVDGFVLDEACRQLSAWLGEDGWPDDFTMAVNVSGRELTDPSLATRVAKVLANHGLDPSRLCLEVTETALIGEAGDVEATLAGLSAFGVRLALDDFGTGYSTLAHLQRLRVDILKIDRSFVEQVGRSPRNREIVAAVTAMAHALGMSVVAEGIETTEQLDELALLNCDVGQGFLFARPLPPEAVAELQRSTPQARDPRSSPGIPLAS
ncbi:MAG TPA: EAL domain-containing protein [Acidimicrobiales bacterium]|nr:EAL domain-containing protein [Acidimicrobiales bacterium]